MSLVVHQFEATNPALLLLSTRLPQHILKIIFQESNHIFACSRFSVWVWRLGKIGNVSFYIAIEPSPFLHHKQLQVEPHLGMWRKQFHQPAGSAALGGVQHHPLARIIKGVIGALRRRQAVVSAVQNGGSWTQKCGNQSHLSAPHVQVHTSSQWLALWLTAVAGFLGCTICMATLQLFRLSISVHEHMLPLLKGSFNTKLFVCVRADRHNQMIDHNKRVTD